MPYSQWYITGCSAQLWLISVAAFLCSLSPQWLSLQLWCSPVHHEAAAGRSWVQLCWQRCWADSGKTFWDLGHSVVDGRQWIVLPVPEHTLGVRGTGRVQQYACPVQLWRISHWLYRPSRVGQRQPIRFPVSMLRCLEVCGWWSHWWPDRCMGLAGCLGSQGSQAGQQWAPVWGWLWQAQNADRVSGLVASAKASAAYLFINALSGNVSWLKALKTLPHGSTWLLFLKEPGVKNSHSKFFGETGLRHNYIH